jgi:adenylylsulfate kinase-like enzyme
LPRVLAGPKEAIQNFILFNNLGAKKFFIGRGKNCVGDFYDEKEPITKTKEFIKHWKLQIELEEEENIFSDDGQMIRASSIKKDYVDKGIIPPPDLMDFNIFSILSDNIKLVDAEELLKSTPKIIYISGLSGSGKTTIAKELQYRIGGVILDGDEIRNTLNKDLGFTYEEKVKNIRRNNELIKFLSERLDRPIICAFMSSIGEVRNELFDEVDNIFKVQLTTPIEVCMKRDTKGLYKKKPENFGGVTSNYCPISEPDLEIDTSEISVYDAVDMIMEKIFF